MPASKHCEIVSKSSSASIPKFLQSQINEGLQNMLPGYLGATSTRTYRTIARYKYQPQQIRLYPSPEQEEHQRNRWRKYTACCPAQCIINHGFNTEQNAKLHLAQSCNHRLDKIRPEPLFVEQ